MIDERTEFQCYTAFPDYRTASVKDTAFLNRISFPPPIRILSAGTIPR